MADLGSIEFRNPGGNVETTAKEQTNRDVLAAVGQIGAIANEKAVEDVLGQFRDDLNEKTDQLAATTEAAKPIPTGDPQLDRLRDLQFTAAQGDLKQQERAALEGRVLLQSAITRNPRLRSELLTEFRSFVAGDPEFAALGLQDAATVSSSKLAMKEIDRITDEAFGDGEGQLGMDPVQYPFGTRKFVEQYTYLSSLEAQRNQNRLTIAAMDSQRDIDVRSEAAKWQAGLLGQREIVSGMIGTASKRMIEIEAARQNPEDPNNVAVLTNFNEFERDAILSDINSNIDNLNLQASQIPLKWVDTPEYRAIIALKDATVLELRTLAEAVVSETPGITEIHTALQTPRRS
jgi:hypothetical protein